ncbi:receptor-type tyrosine-protein phosphatase alpha-like [Mya arenaria]|uniref:receptor-type tyrosine-protein phosphatase alpha-like n=1 Tax=Mya arenaria TaxID=6604 RepID=UPI0022E6C424|nr:receptor-type tyrosine-protein phosphatase alpha-like [Mya arenaria]
MSLKTEHGIQIYKLWDYIRDKKKTEHFDHEFSELPTGLVYKHDVAEREENKGKNRYREMYAYDHSRVPLQKEKDGDCDYINASYIDGYGKAQKFIASQGPNKSMIDEFWRMVWQENAEKIVMLTNLIEMATVKCLQYWPEMGQTCSYGGIDISITDVKKFRDYEIRTLVAKKAQSKSRRIHQYHFRTWPDNDVPDNGWCLVMFLNAVETHSASAPIIVHCSAGVGRSGTFIALDNLVDQAKTEKYVKPLQMVEAMRYQRVNMVQTKDQYIYLHEALAEALLIGTDHVWYWQFENVHSFMIAREPGDKQTRLVKQFQLIEQSLTNEAEQVQEGPEYGNMETIISELDAYRPKLKKRGLSFTQQLDAILLPSFSGKNTFILCKSPCEEQLEEFWSLVEEQHVITVIMLTSTSSRAHQDEEDVTTIKQFQFTGWTKNATIPPLKNMLECLDDVRMWQPHLDENRPVLIHCETGYERSGLIAVLLNELQRMEMTRGKINIVETVKTMKQRNRDIIPSAIQVRQQQEASAGPGKKRQNPIGSQIKSTSSESECPKLIFPPSPEKHVFILSSASSVQAEAYVDVTNFKFTPSSSIPVKDPSDAIDSWLTSMLLLPMNRLLLTDYHNETVKLVDLETSRLVSQVRVPGGPCDMCLLPGDRVAVSLTSGKIQFLETRGEIALGANIRVDSDSRGNGYHNDRLILS